MKKCIGIISYLPDKFGMRIDRIRCLEELLTRINELFPSVDVMIVTQNWGSYNPPQVNDRYILHHFDKPLGITPARKKLREYFLDSDYDYLIMLDDDCILEGSSASKYLEAIDSHPGGVGIFSTHLLKLFAISKKCYSELDMPNISAEKGEGFEDRAFINMCMAKFGDKCFNFESTGLQETSYGNTDPHRPSTWWNSSYRKMKADMVRKTDAAIEQFNTQVGYENKVDIVVTYVNMQDKQWLNTYNYWKAKENPSTSDQHASSIRYRNTETFRFFLRSVEKNCTWVNKVFLVVASESQLPVWIDKNCDKLRIVYHDEYIPKELLPTFNSNVIEAYLSNIEDLSDNYVLCNDDTFFLNTSRLDDFFVNDMPVYSVHELPLIKGTDDFFKTLVNNQNLLCKIFNIKHSFKHPHLQTAHKKSVEKFILSKWCDEFFNSFKSSHFRHVTNLTVWFYDDYLKAAQLGVNNPNLYKFCSNVTLKSTLNLIDYTDYRLLCVNDTKSTDNFELSASKLRIFLSSKFPAKSCFEIDDYKGNSITSSRNVSYFW